MYLILAGFERFFVEFIRTNEKYFLDILSGAQIISLRSKDAYKGKGIHFEGAVIRKKQGKSVKGA